MMKNKKKKYSSESTFGISSRSFPSKELANAMLDITPGNTVIKHKYGISGKEKVKFQMKKGGPESLYIALTSGYMITHPQRNWTAYRMNKGKTTLVPYYGLSEKTNINFAGTWFIPIDIDETKCQSVEEYLNKLSYQPTFWYTTYSHLLPGKGVRLRMVYCFNRFMDGCSYIRYRWYAWNLVGRIESETGEKVDHASLNASQYFNGVDKTTAPNFESGWIGKIYHWWELDGDDREAYKKWLDAGCDYSKDTDSISRNLPEIRREGGNPPEYQVETDIEEHVLSDYIAYGFNEYFRQEYWKLSLPEETHPLDWTKDIERQWIDPEEPYVKIFHWRDKIEKGHRKQTLLSNGQILRIINPQATPTQVFYMMAYYNHYIFTQRLGWRDLVYVIDFLFNQETMEDCWREQKDWIEECEEKYRPKYVFNPFKKFSRGDMNRYRSIDRDNKIKQTLVYDGRLTCRENYERLKEIDPSITYEQVKEFHTNNRWDKPRLVRENYDPGLSLEENTKRINEKFELNLSETMVYENCGIDFSSQIIKDKKKEIKDKRIEIKRKERIINIINSGLVDPNQSFRWNMNILRNNGIKITQDILKEVLIVLHSPLL